MTEKAKNWLRDNAAVVSVTISTAIILLSLAIAWGETHAEVANLDRRLTVAEVAIRSHHEDTARHVDPAWKEDIRQQLQEIRALLIEHMSRKEPSPGSQE